LDTDVFIFKPFPKDWFNAPFLMGQEGDHGLGNSIMWSKPGSRFTSIWIKEYSTFNESNWSGHSIQLPKKLWLKYPEDIRVLGPKRFFYPLWYPEEILKVYKENQFTFGKDEPLQYAWHAWSQMAWEKYMRNLTVDEIRFGKSSFTRALQAFL
jgi:hypothetical protein